MSTKKQSQKEVKTQLQTNLPVLNLTEKDMSRVSGGGTLNAI